MTDKEQIMIDSIDVSGCDNHSSQGNCITYGNTPCDWFPDCDFKQLARKTQECEELKTENEELNNRMAEVTYRATGGRLSYSNYTLDAIEQAFNDQLEILSDHKVENETKELKQKLYLAQNEVHFKTEYIQEQRDIIKKLERECEELKDYARRQENQRETYYKEFLKKDKYYKALKEIEEYCDMQISLTGDLPFRTTESDILDIINKAKGEE